MVLDHSLTYKKISFKNIAHMLRMRKIIDLIKKYKGVNSYADVGCSNGYLTDIVSRAVLSKNTHGYDHSDNLGIARELFPKYEFLFLDLNIKIDSPKRYQLVTCFETLEHVGNLSNAVNNLASMTDEDGVLIISVPIEIGMVGLAKYLIKRYLYGYDLPLTCNDAGYVKSLLLKKNISQFRKAQNGYGSHFGFDFRDVDKAVTQTFPKSSIQMISKWSTRFYIIKNKIK